MKTPIFRFLTNSAQIKLKPEKNSLMVNRSDCQIGQAVQDDMSGKKITDFANGWREQRVEKHS